MKPQSKNYAIPLAPKSSKDFSELLAELYEDSRPWHPCGLCTRVHWGPRLHESSIAISTRALRNVIKFSPEDLIVTVEAGISVGELQATLREKNQWLAIDWPWGSSPKSNQESTGTIGGLISRGFSGSLRHRHLGVRDQIIGIGIMRTDGIEAHAGGKVVKNVAGYDLMRLLCGSWGSLALIKELTLRTQPIKPANSQIEINGSLLAIESFRQDLINSSFTPEYIDWVGGSQKTWHLKIGLSSVSLKAIKDQLKGIKELAKNYKLHTNTNDWDGPLPKNQFPKVTSKDLPWLIRISIPPSKGHELISSSFLKALNGWEWHIAAGIGLGEGWQEKSSCNTSLEEVKKLRKLINSIGGEMTVLIQPASKENYMESWSDSPAKSIIQSVKKQFDPNQQLSIGRLPGVAS